MAEISQNQIDNLALMFSTEILYLMPRLILRSTHSLLSVYQDTLLTSSSSQRLSRMML